MALILTTPVYTGQTESIIYDIVPSSATKVVDTVELLHKNTVHWIVEITDQLTNDRLSQQILATVSNSNVKYSRYSLIGTLLSHTINITYTGTSLELSISNSSSNQFDVTIIK